MSRSDRCLSPRLVAASLALPCALTALSACAATRPPSYEPGELTEICRLPIDDHEVAVWQDDEQDCVPATLASLVRILRRGTEISCADVARPLRAQQAKAGHDGGYLSADAALHYFNDRLAPKYHLHALARREDADLDRDVVPRLRRGEPVVVSYLSSPFTDAQRYVANVGLAVLGVVEAPFSLFGSLVGSGGSPLVEPVARGDRQVRSYYLHAGVVVGLYRDQHGDRVVRLTDPWCGHGPLSDRSDGFLELPEKDFVRRWKHWGQLGITPEESDHWAAYAAPGTALVLGR